MSLWPKITHKHAHTCTNTDIYIHKLSIISAAFAYAKLLTQTVGSVNCELATIKTTPDLHLVMQHLEVWLSWSEYQTAIICRYARVERHIC